MLKVAQELNLSETAFIRASERIERFSIRYFSPKMEIPLCGHATLASARVLFAARGLSDMHFTTATEVQLAVRASQSAIEMTFPVYQTTPAEASRPLLAALGLESVKNSAYNAEMKILLLEITSPAVLAGLVPNFEALLRSHTAVNGVLVTAASGADGYDFHSRFFWPWSGSNEDPVTGATHTFLSKYWSDRLGKKKMMSYQSSSRSGSMEVELVGEKVLIRSQAVIVLEGELKL